MSRSDPPPRSDASPEATSAGEPASAARTGSPPRSGSLSRRDVLAGVGAGLAGAGLTTQVGTTAAADLTLAPLARDRNRLVDPEGEPVTLRGTTIADPGEQSRDWRGMDALDVLDVATAHPDWDNAVVRVPIQPEFAATGESAASGPAPADLPHRDEWGPALPGTFDEATLEAYLDAVVDPLVERAAENGAYLMLVYYRHRPVFYHAQHEAYVRDGQPIADAEYDDLADVWDCEADGAVDHSVLAASEDYDAFEDGERYPDVCGERGLLWHGEDQIDAVLDLAVEQEVIENFYDVQSLDDVYTEPPAVCNALDAEVDAFWHVVAERYGEHDHVLFDVYHRPTGPYAGDWGGPDRTPGSLSDTASGDYRYELWGEFAEPFHALWHERSEPWVDVVENNSQGQVKTIGNPRFSQYAYWAPYHEYDVENACYSANVQLQEACRPLEDTVGRAAEVVPVFFSEFGWMDRNLYVPTPWMTRGVRGLEWATGEEDPTGGMSFERFLEEFPVHPICGAFDHSWRPNFFDHGTPGVEGDGARGSDHWHDDGYLLEERTPGEWWRSYLAEHETTVAPGEEPYECALQGPNDLDGSRSGGYAYPLGEEPAPGTLGGYRYYHDHSGCESGEPCADAATAEVEGQVVCDLTEDGLFRDVTADGEVGQDDVVHFFENQHRDAWKQPDLFDFSESGSVGHGDVVALFEYVAL